MERQSRMQTALPYLLAALAFIFIRIINYNILTPGILSPIVKFKILKAHFINCCAGAYGGIRT